MSLQSALEHATAGVIEMQEVLDRAYADELRLYRDLLRTDPSGSTSSFLTELVPLRQRMEYSEMDFSVMIDLQRTHGFDIQAKMLNLGYEHRYGITRSEASRIKITVHQVPLQKEDQDE
jgi:hypothetical protein